MSSEPFLFVLGTGSAANACARTVARAGHSVVAAENDRVGGLCLWAGCMPKKALYNAAASVRSLKRMEQWGVTCGNASLDWDAVLAWKWHAQETYAGDQEGIAGDAGVQLVEGAARFRAPGVIEVDGVEYRPEHILIATGSEPILPDIAGAELASTSRDALSYPTLPTSLVIVGGGFIAMEMAGIYASFGTKVTVLVRGDRLLERIDPELVGIAVHRLEELGVDFRFETSVNELSGSPGSLAIELQHAPVPPDVLDDRETIIYAEQVLFAIGRRPALADIGLDVAGLDRDERGGLVVHEQVRTSDPSVFVAGDAAGGAQFTPYASASGAYVASLLLGEPGQAPDPDTIPATVFTAPQLAFVGLTEEQARDAGIKHTVKRGTFEYVGAAIIADDRRGVVKLVVGDDDRILGAHIAGPEASDLIYPYALAMRLGATATDVAATRAVHPAFSEAVNWSAW